MANYVQWIVKTTAQWVTVGSSFVLLKGQIGIEDHGSGVYTGRLGDGTTVWNSLTDIWLPLSYLDTDGTLAANSDAKVASQKAVKTYVGTAVTGLLDFKGLTDCSANPNYPAASKGDAYIVSVAGKIGGASGTTVDVGDWYIANADNAGGTEASVGTSWGHIEHNLIGAMLAANNLSDLANKATALANLSGQAGADFSLNTHKLTSVTDPTSAQDAATKAYADGLQHAAQPSWHGLKAWSFDPAVIGASTIIPTAGVINLVKIWCPAAITITGLSVWLQTIGSGLTNVGFGLYDSSANLLQSSVNANGATTAVFTGTAGLKTVTITSQAVAAGAAVFVGFWFTGTTMPTLGRGTQTNAMTAGQSSPNLRFATANTGLTTTPPNPFGAQSIAAAAWWAAIA